MPKRNRWTLAAWTLLWALSMVALAPKAAAAKCICWDRILGVPVCCEYAPDPPPPTNPQPKRPFEPIPGEPIDR